MHYRLQSILFCTTEHNVKKIHDNPICEIQKQKLNKKIQAATKAD